MNERKEGEKNKRITSFIGSHSNLLTSVQQWSCHLRFCDLCLSRLGYYMSHPTFILRANAQTHYATATVVTMLSLVNPTYVTMLSLVNSTHVTMQSVINPICMLQCLARFGSELCDTIYKDRDLTQISIKHTDSLQTPQKS